MATVKPSTRSEQQLYQVLLKANLLKYFETFIAQGGDDVQQLCEAGEDEFLEIMALVGMASKPLHVRRLQKALQEWVANPAAFEVAKKYPNFVMSMTGSPSQNASPTHSLERSSNIQDYKVTPPQSSAISTTSTPWKSQTRDITISDNSNMDDPNSSDSQQGEPKEMKDYLFSQLDQSYSNNMDICQPLLLEHQIAAIATAAGMLAQDLPPIEPKSMSRRQISQEITTVIQMSPDDPNRMKALRKYAAIYGRFDSKRKNDRPMTLHEISVNEAAAQLCSHFPALLTRREELFPLARQVVRDSGYQYSKGHSRASEILVQSKLELGDAIPSTATVISMRHEDSLSDLQAELTQITLELTELVKEQDCIRSALRVLLETNDHDQMKKLTAEMDILNDRQTAMKKKQHRIENAIARYRKNDSKYSLPAVTDSELLLRESSSHVLNFAKSVSNGSRYSSTGCHGYNDELIPNSPLSTLYMAALQNHKDSLFEEGLRIATQYGMSDFAKELIGMKSTREVVESEKDSGFGEFSERISNSGFLPRSSSSSFSISSSGAVPTSSLYSISGSKKCLPLSLSLVSSEQSFMRSSISSGNPSSSDVSKLIPVSNSDYINKQMPTGLLSTEVFHSSSDGSVEDACDVDNYAVLKSSQMCSKQNVSITTSDNIIAQSSITTPKIISTNSDIVMESETRRSSRRKNGDPDYYLINGGEKRFRSENSR